jgi:hypothetical protein
VRIPTVLTNAQSDTGIPPHNVNSITKTSLQIHGFVLPCLDCNDRSIVRRRFEDKGTQEMPYDLLDEWYPLELHLRNGGIHMTRKAQTLNDPKRKSVIRHTSESREKTGMVVLTNLKKSSSRMAASPIYSVPCKVQSVGHRVSRKFSLHSRINSAKLCEIELCTNAQAQPDSYCHWFLSNCA